MTVGKCIFGPDEQVAYVYKDMKPEEAAAFRDHLPTCPTCLQAVAELGEFASVCRKMREQPDVEMDWKKPVPVRLTTPPPRRSWRPSVWMPASTALASLVVVIAVVALCQPIEPHDTPDEKAAVAPAIERAGVVPDAHVEVAGTLKVRRADRAEVAALTGQARVAPGDTLTTPGEEPAEITLEDGSRLALAERSSLRVHGLTASGDRLELLEGSVVCEVTPRTAGRTFSVVAGPGLVVVKGTRFLVRLEESGQLTVGVIEGVVTLAPRNDPAAATDIRAGEQANLVPSATISRRSLDAKLHTLLGGEPPALAEIRKAPRRRVVARRPSPPVKPAKTNEPEIPPPLTGKTPEPPRPAPVVDDWSRGLEDHHNWIFDMLRSEIQKGRCEDVLRKLDNYLSDPESPARDEATYLKAVCLEKLGRSQDAARVYDDYLKRWPRGARAEAARRAAARNRAVP